MYVLGKYLSTKAVEQFMMRSWNFIQLSYLFYHEEDYFLLIFHYFKDKDLILRRGPYIIYNMLMIIRDWYTDFNFKRDMVQTVPVWVKFP